METRFLADNMMSLVVGFVIGLLLLGCVGSPWMGCGLGFRGVFIAGEGFAGEPPATPVSTLLFDGFGLMDSTALGFAVGCFMVCFNSTSRIGDILIFSLFQGLGNNRNINTNSKGKKLCLSQCVKSGCCQLG
ncbi:MAG: hypothetical protein KDI92_10575 [Xanthomonadales bacterium]|nr:hypothetical protein [Xanthomonadales bacterium]